MVMAMLFREVFGSVAANPPDLNALADQHSRTALRGLLRPAIGDADGWMTKMTHTDVLIIGAGPTGLVLALWLTKLGVKVQHSRQDGGAWHHLAGPWRFKRGRSNSTASSTLPTP